MGSFYFTVDICINVFFLLLTSDEVTLYMIFTFCSLTSTKKCGNINKKTAYLRRFFFNNVNGK